MVTVMFHKNDQLSAAANIQKRNKALPSMLINKESRNERISESSARNAQATHPANHTNKRSIAAAQRDSDVSCMTS